MATRAPSFSARSCSRRSTFGSRAAAPLAAPGAAGCLQPAHQRLGLAHGETLLHDQRRDFDLLAAVVERQQRPRMTHLERALLEQLAHLRGQLEQAQQVADRGARAPDRLGRLLVRELELADQALEGARLFQRD